MKRLQQKHVTSSWYILLKGWCTNEYDDSQEFVIKSVIRKIIKKSCQVMLLGAILWRSSSPLGTWEAHLKYQLINASIYLAKLESLKAWVPHVSWFTCLLNTQHLLNIYYVWRDVVGNKEEYKTVHNPRDMSWCYQIKISLHRCLRH